MIAAIIISSIYYYPLPYFISKPGDALELAPIIQVEGGSEKEGTFMLTTIRIGGANLFNYVWANWNTYMEIIPKELLLANHESEEEYTERQLRVMKNSQENAIILAYRLAGKKVEVIEEGVIVEGVSADMPAQGILKPGDIIHSIDGHTVNNAEQLIKYVQAQQVGKEIALKFKREGEIVQEKLVLAELPLSKEEVEKQTPPKAGLGISISTKRTVSAKPPLHIDTERIGGPSAGLMFSLEIYNQLTEEDITKGYRIAGTGTIDPEGKVGRIGGIHQKVVAADKAKADIFFAPRDGGNYDKALEAAKDIGTTMEIVPVSSIQDALDYLNRLPKK